MENVGQEGGVLKNEISVLIKKTPSCEVTERR